MAAALWRAPVPGGGGILVVRNGPPLCHISNRKSRSFCRSSSLSSKLSAPAPAGLLRLQRGVRGVVVRRRRPQLPPLLCFFGIGGAGSGRRRDDSTGVEDDEDADIEELVIRSRGKLVIDVHPLQEARREEEEAVRKGKEMLFEQLRLHLGVTPQELRAMWRAEGGVEEKRLRLVRDFLEGEWGWRYRPLSPRAAVEMLDEHMGMWSLEGRAEAAAAAAVARGPRRLIPNWWR